MNSLLLYVHIPQTVGYYYDESDEENVPTAIGDDNNTDGTGQLLQNTTIPSYAYFTNKLSHIDGLPKTFAYAQQGVRYPQAIKARIAALCRWHLANHMDEHDLLKQEDGLLRLRSKSQANIKPFLAAILARLRSDVEIDNATKFVSGAWDDESLSPPLGSTSRGRYAHSDALNAKQTT